MVRRLRSTPIKGLKYSVDSDKMKLGKESRYAIEGLVVLAKKPAGTTMQLRDIAEAAEVLPDADRAAR